MTIEEQQYPRRIVDIDGQPLIHHHVVIDTHNSYPSLLDNIVDFNFFSLSFFSYLPSECRQIIFFFYSVNTLHVFHTTQDIDTDSLSNKYDKNRYQRRKACLKALAPTRILLQGVNSPSNTSFTLYLHFFRCRM